MAQTSLVELRVERMIHNAKSIARLDNGQIALLTGGLPQELVLAQLTKTKGVLQGQVTKVLEASDNRQKPQLHPGLNYSHINYSYQLELKREVIKDALSRSLKQEFLVPELHAAPFVWDYRSSIQPVVTRQGLGYRLPESHEVITLENDPVANDAIKQAWQRFLLQTTPKGLREVVFRGNDAGEVLISLIASASARNYLDFAHKLVADGVKGVNYAQFDARGRFRQGSEKLTGDKTIRQAYGEFDVTVSATSFAQPNPSAATKLYERLRDLAPSGKQALDLYAGSGLIAMHLASKFEQLSALEIDGSSIMRGKADTERLGLNNIHFIKADARNLDLPEQLDLITVDPPRSGLNKEVRSLISASSSPMLIYVSCDVATWARDIADFVEQGWTLSRYEGFDFYPHTHHIELLSVLTR